MRFLFTLLGLLGLMQLAIPSEVAPTSTIYFDRFADCGSCLDALAVMCPRKGIVSDYEGDCSCAMDSPFYMMRFECDFLCYRGPRESEVYVIFGKHCDGTTKGVKVIMSYPSLSPGESIAMESFRSELEARTSMATAMPSDQSASAPATAKPTITLDASFPTGSIEKKLSDGEEGFGSKTSGSMRTTVYVWALILGIGVGAFGVFGEWAV